MKNSHLDWLMRKIAEETIRERLDVSASERNITQLAKLLTTFEAEALAITEDPPADHNKKNDDYWFTSIDYQLSTQITHTMRP